MEITGFRFPLKFFTAYKMLESFLYKKFYKYGQAKREAL